MTGIGNFYAIMLDPAAYLHPTRRPCDELTWRALPYDARNAIVMSHFNLTTPGADAVSNDPHIAHLLTCWGNLTSLCFYLGAYSQRAELIASLKYRTLSYPCQKFLELPLAHVQAPACVRSNAIDPSVCGLAGLKLMIPTLPACLRARLDLIFPIEICDMAARLGSSTQMYGWISTTLFTMASSYAQSHFENV